MLSCIDILVVHADHHRVMEGEENRRPLHHANATPSESDDISDIDARLNALQSFLKAAKEKAKRASSARTVRA